MIEVVLIIHLILAIALVGVVLLQRSEGGALGMGGGSGMSGFMTGRGSANLLTRITTILAAAFILTSLTLAKLAETGRSDQSILDEVPEAVESLPEEPPTPSPPLAR